MPTLKVPGAHVWSVKTPECHRCRWVETPLRSSCSCSARSPSWLMGVTGGPCGASGGRRLAGLLRGALYHCLPRDGRDSSWLIIPLRRETFRPCHLLSFLRFVPRFCSGTASGARSDFCVCVLTQSPLERVTRGHNHSVWNSGSLDGSALEGLERRRES